MPKNIIKHVAKVTYKIFSFICVILLVACCDSTNATINKGGVTLGNMSIAPITSKQQSSLLKQVCGPTTFMLSCVFYYLKLSFHYSLIFPFFTIDHHQVANFMLIVHVFHFDLRMMNIIHHYESPT